MSESVERAAEALLSVALHEADRTWAEALCLRALGDSRAGVVAAAVTSLGHIARLHRQVGPEVISALQRMRDNRDLAGLVEDTLDDIVIFVAAPGA